MSHTIMLCFVRSDSSILEESWLNRAASWFAGGTELPYIHAEILFMPPGRSRSTDDMTGLACSIVYGGKVHLQEKRFSRKEWRFRSINVSKSQYDDMLTFCEDHQGDPFNYVGYFTYWSPLTMKPSWYPYLGLQSRWYCSQIVVGALKAGGCLDVSVTDSMHPNALYNMMAPRTMADCGRNMNNISLKFV